MELILAAFLLALARSARPGVTRDENTRQFHSTAADISPPNLKS